MRRAAPPQNVRVDPTDPGPFSRVGGGPRGLRLEPTAAPAGDVRPDDRSLRPARAVPFATHQAVIVNDGALAFTVAPGVARTIRLPDMVGLFDRRPPGVNAVYGAFHANAGAMRDDSGWRAVVLPSMGDLVADLGPGPFALRSDGRSAAVVHDGRIFEIEVPGATTTEVPEGEAEALAYAADGTLIVGAGGGIGGDGSDSPMIQLVSAGAADRCASLHQNGTVTIWDTTNRAVVAAWSAPPGAGEIALSPDGTQVSVSTVDGDDVAAHVVHAQDGAVARCVIGARTIAFDPAQRGLFVGGDWGALWMEPPREVS